MTSYSGVADHTTDRFWERVDNTPSGVLYADSAVRIADITDGTSHTLMLAESVVSQEDSWKTENPSYCPGGACYVGRAWSEGNIITTAYGINSPPAPARRPKIRHKIADRARNGRNHRRFQAGNDKHVA